MTQKLCLLLVLLATSLMGQVGSKAVATGPGVRSNYGQAGQRPIDLA